VREGQVNDRDRRSIAGGGSIYAFRKLQGLIVPSRGIGAVTSGVKRMSGRVQLTA